ncbi:Rv1733c family protein [Streptomyces sp. NPDC054842]
MPEAEYASTRRHLMWRWRSNPLRRHADVVEAWIVVAVWAAVSLGGTFVGAMTAHGIDQSFAERRAALRPAQGVLLESTMDAVPMAEGPQRISVRAEVRWTAPDGGTHTSRAWVDAGREAGAIVPVWTDGQGRLTREPPSAGEAATESALLGAGAGAAFGGMTYAGGRAVRWRLDRRRYDLWAREWETVGPRWRRRTT